MSTAGSLRHQLADELRERIRAGEWAPGERLPSEPELARRQAVSRSSLRSAIAILEEEGYINRRHGSGTYVAHRPALPNDLSRNFGVSSLIRATGLEPGIAEQSVEIVIAPPAVAAALDLEPDEPVAVVRRVRTASGRRVAYTIDWCRSDHLDLDALSGLGAGSIYEAFAARGMAVHHGVARLSPRNADDEIAERLGVPRGSLLLTIDQRDSLADGVAVLVSREHHLADAFSFTVLRHGPGTGGDGD